MDSDPIACNLCSIDSNSHTTSLLDNYMNLTRPILSDSIVFCSPRRFDGCQWWVSFADDAKRNKWRGKKEKCERAEDKDIRAFWHFLLRRRQCIPIDRFLSDEHGRTLTVTYHWSDAIRWQIRTQMHARIFGSRANVILFFGKFIVEWNAAKIERTNVMRLISVV